MQLDIRSAGFRRRIAIVSLALLALVFLLIWLRSSEDEIPEVKPPLGLITTLPLQRSEGGIEADLVKDAKAHPAYDRLNQRYKLRPLNDLNSLQGRPGELLLLAQPRAFDQAELARLDAWVRGGGRLMILADAALQWGSLYSIGDKRRPLFTSVFSTLFSSWGLELVLPMTDDEAIAIRDVDGFSIRTKTPGEWLAKSGKADPTCKIKARGLMADCRIGKGRAILLADADLLDTVYWEGRGVRAITGKDEFGNMLWVEHALSALTHGTR